MYLLGAEEEPCVVGSLHIAWVGRPYVMVPCWVDLDSRQGYFGLRRGHKVIQVASNSGTADPYLARREMDLTVVCSLAAVMERRMVVGALRRHLDHGHFLG